MPCGAFREATALGSNHHDLTTAKLVLEARWAE